jgi:hypothetical protein
MHVMVAATTTRPHRARAITCGGAQACGVAGAPQRWRDALALDHSVIAAKLAALASDGLFDSASGVWTEFCAAVQQQQERPSGGSGAATAASDSAPAVARPPTLALYNVALQALGAEVAVAAAQRKAVEAAAAASASSDGGDAMAVRDIGAAAGLASAAHATMQAACGRMRVILGEMAGCGVAPDMCTLLAVTMVRAAASRVRATIRANCDIMMVVVHDTHSRRFL